MLPQEIGVVFETPVRLRQVSVPHITGFQTGSGQTGFSQKGHEFHTVCNILF